MRRESSARLAIALHCLTLALGCASSSHMGDSTSRTPALVEQAQRFRSLVESADYATAKTMLVDDARRWFEDRLGPGQPWRIDLATSDPWHRWDTHFRSQKEQVSWSAQGQTAILTIRETNDYFQLLERGWNTTEVVYYFDAAGKIEGVLIRAVGERPPGRTEEFLRWAREHEPLEIDYLMPGGEIDPTEDRPARFRALLNRWREAALLAPYP